MVAPSAAALGKAKLIAPDLLVRDLTVRNDGAIYATATSQQQTGELWLLPRDRAPVRLDGSLKGPAGVALTPDGLWLVALEMNSHDALSYRVGRDGTTDAREPLYDFYVPAGADNSGAASLAMDRDGRAYVATSAGVQVMDRNGRVTAILPLPDDQPATSLCFGGPSFDQLYVAAGDKVFWRTLRVQGAPPWAAPIQLPVWGPG
jgi:sugar lactone lactonase YvrE